MPATAADPDQVAAARAAVEQLAISEEVQDAEPEEENDEDQDEPSAVAAAGGSGSTSKKKKKKKSKGKGGAALDKLKSALTSTSPGGSSSVAASTSKQNATPGITDELYERIVAEARKNVGEEEAKKLDRQAVVEMVECALAHSVDTYLIYY